jgi:hypothetical protein
VLRDGRASRPGRASASATPTATASCPKARSSSRPLFRASPGDPPRSAPRWTASPPSARPPAAAQPHRRLDLQEPAGRQGLALIDAAGCRGLTIGDAQVSEKHCNFLLNLGNASAAPTSRRWARKSAAACASTRRRARMGNPARGGEAKSPNGEAAPHRRADGRLVGRARGVADQRRGRRRRAGEPAGHRVTEIDMDRNVAQVLEAKPDVVFNALHGTPGRGRHRAGHAGPDGHPLHP